MRYITAEQIPEPLDLAVMDLSFISVKLILPAVCPLLKDDAAVVCLIKPQFEAGREKVGKKGVVRDRAVHEEVIRMVMDYASSIDFYPLALDFSPVKGPEGNIEYLLFLSKNKQDQEIVDASSIDIKAVVTASHDTLDKEPGNE